jgi:hypothetical protein
MLSRREWLRTSLLGAAGAIIVRPEPAAAAPLPVVTVYKDKGCQCCGKWVQHLTQNGFVVNAQNVDNLDEIKRTMNVPKQLQTCHTAVVGKYVVEGHVPADVIKKMLAEKPAILGLGTIPGMPAGSPGMEMGNMKDKYDVIAFDRSGKTRVYAKR